MLQTLCCQTKALNRLDAQTGKMATVVGAHCDNNVLKKATMSFVNHFHTYSWQAAVGMSVGILCRATAKMSGTEMIRAAFDPISCHIKQSKFCLEKSSNFLNLRYSRVSAKKVSNYPFHGYACVLLLLIISAHVSE